MIWIFYDGHLGFQDGRPEKTNTTISWVLCKVETRFKCLFTCFQAQEMHLKHIYLDVLMQERLISQYEGHPISSENDPIKQNLFL